MTLLAPLPAPARPRDTGRITTHREVSQPFLLTTSVHEQDPPIVWPPHRHDEHELLWTDRGVVTMFVDGRQWTITPGVGLWIPRGVEHEGSAENRTAVRATYFAPEAWPKRWQGPTTVRVNGAVRQLLIHLRRARMSIEQRVRAQQVCIDMLEVAESIQLEIPLPQDARLAPLVQSLLHDPADDRSLEQWAARLNMTSRTLTRAFAAEISMSFARWRRLVRMRAAVGQLAGGTSVKVVARRVGYNSTSAFVAAFRRTVGCTPGEVTGDLTGEAA